MTTTHPACDLPGLPQDDAGPVFSAPWQAQAFAMTLALHERGLFSWGEWAQALSQAIASAQAAGDPDLGDTYYHHWLDALETLLRDNPGVRPEKLVSAHVAGDNGEGVRGVSDFLDLARDPQIVELVSDVIGEDVILWGCHVFCKLPGEGYETPWHQDGHYWPIRPLATCTVWIACDDATPENGCLRVIRGSHRRKSLYRHNQGFGQRLPKRRSGQSLRIPFIA
jgi:nitrile hydratase accessory protein